MRSVFQTEAGNDSRLRIIVNRPNRSMACVDPGVDDRPADVFSLDVERRPGGIRPGRRHRVPNGGLNLTVSIDRVNPGAVECCTQFTPTRTNTDCPVSAESGV